MKTRRGDKMRGGFNTSLGLDRKHDYAVLHSSAVSGSPHREGDAWQVSFSTPVLEGFWLDELAKAGYVELKREVVLGQRSYLSPETRFVKSAIILATKIDRHYWRSVGLPGSTVEKLGRPVAYRVNAACRFASDEQVPLEMGAISEMLRYDRGVRVGYFSPGALPEYGEPARALQVTCVFFTKSRAKNAEPTLTWGRWRSFGIHQSQFKKVEFNF